jgi:putative ABC transport system permease protein
VRDLFYVASIVSVLAIIALTLVYAYKYLTLSKISMRNAFRRKMSMLLIIAGSLTGTAFIVGSFVINDSFQYFMFSNIRRTMGSVDEIVKPKGAYFNEKTLNELINALHSSSYVDGVLPISTKKTIASKNGKMRSLDPRSITTVSFIGVDLNQIKKFGNGYLFPNLQLKGNEVVIGKALADYLKLKVGDTLQALSNPLQLLFGVPPSFKVAAIVPQNGILGYQGTNGFTLPIFVTPSQMKQFFGVNGYNQLLVSNLGDYLEGVKYTKEVDNVIKKVAGESVKIENVKDQQIKSVKSQQIGKLFILLSSFAIAAGTLLIVNIYTMLADERKSSLGTLRAIGFSRKKIGFILYFEGFIYSLIASIVGTVVGLLVAWFMINEFSGFFSNTSRELSNLFSMQPSPFVLHFNISSLVYGFSFGIMIPLLVLLFMAIRIGRLNIVKAIRNIPDDPLQNRRKHLWALITIISVFVLLIFFGNFSLDAFSFYTGVVGVALFFPSFFRKSRLKRYVGNFAALFVIVFAFFSNNIPYVENASANSMWFLGLKSFSILVAALFFLAYDIEIFDKLFSKLSTKSLRASFKLAMAEAAQNKKRTGMTIAMYAIVIFVISLMTIVPYSQVVQVKNGQETIFQGYDAVGLPLSGGSVKVTPQQLENMKYVSYYATASMFSIRYEINKIAEKQIYQMVELNKKALLGSQLKIRSAIPEIKDLKSLWDYLEAHPGSVASFGLSKTMPGETVLISKEGNFSFNFSNSSSQGMNLLITGPLKNPKKFKVVATFDNKGLTAFASGFYTTPETVKRAFGDVKGNEFLLVKLAGKTEAEKESSFEKFLAFLKTRFSIGLFSKQLLDVFANMIMSFVNIINSFLYFGLSVGIVGLAILILKTLHERRRTIGILKAVGFTKSKVFASFFIETNFVVILGILSGFVAGWITSSMIYSSLNIGEMFMPWMHLLGLGVIFYMISIFATILPIQRASKLPPAEVLRYYE